MGPEPQLQIDCFAMSDGTLHGQTDKWLKTLPSRNIVGKGKQAIGEAWIFNRFVWKHHRKGSFALGDDDNDKVDFNKLLGIGCMATKESIRTWRWWQNKWQRRCCKWVLYLFGWWRQVENSIVATGQPSFRTFSAAFVYIFCYLFKMSSAFNLQ